MFNKCYRAGDLDIIFEDLINGINEITIKKPGYIFVDYDKTLIENDSYLNLVISILKNNKIKFIYKLINFFLKQIKLNIFKKFFIFSPKSFLKFCISNVIFSISGIDSINKLMIMNHKNNLKKGLLYKLKKLNNIGFHIIIVSNNYNQFLRSIIGKYSFSLLALDIDKFESHVYKLNSKSFRIKNQFNKNDNYILAITDSIKDKDMLKIVSNNIKFDYEEKLYFSIKTN